MPEFIIKICGITRLEDALASLNAGADCLGFIRWPQSPRYRPLEECAELIHAIRAKTPKPFQAVGVFVDAPAAEVNAEIACAGFDRVQLHGTENMEIIRSVNVPAIKTIAIRDASSIRNADAYPGVDLLTDTADPALPGGTGKSYDPSLLCDLVRARRVIVAGGLTPGNVGKVIDYLHPHGVDVSSGVESSPGIKDEKKICNFIRAARESAERG